MNLGSAIRRTTFATAVCAVTLFHGCGREPAGSPADVAPTTALQPSDVHVLGTSRNIAVAQDLEVLADGRVWVLNSIDPFFIGLDSAGNVVHEYGNRGGGPEEFRSPVGFVTGGIDGEAWVLDGGRHSLVEVSRPDGAWSEIILPRSSIPPGSLIGGRDLTDNRVRSARFGDEIVLARTTGSLDAGVFAFWLAIWGADLLAVNPAGDTARQILSLRAVLGDPTAQLGDGQGFAPLPLWFRLWAVCADELHVYDRLRNEVRAFSRDGEEIGATPLPVVDLGHVAHRQFARAILGLLMAERMGAVGTQVSPEDSTRLLNEVLAEGGGEPDQFATFLPRYVDFRCAPDGTQWLRPFDIDVGGLKGGPNWFRITPDGVTAEIRLPDRFDAYRFTADRIWGVQRDELDIASVAWIAMPATH